MSSIYVLVSTVPGMQRRVFDHIASIPEVRAEQLLFGEQIAVKLDASDETFHELPPRLARLDGVLETKVYRGNSSFLLRRASLN